MTRVYITDTLPEERSALRLILLDLNMTVVGEAADWDTTLANAPATRMDMLLLDWDLLPTNGSVAAIAELRAACANVIIIVLLSLLSPREQAARSAGADSFISKSDMPERVIERIRIAAANIHWLQ